jgi:hypothetical protein
MNVEAYAKELGYVTVRKIGRWNNHDVYEPLMDLEDGIPVTGIPVFILSANGVVKLSTPDESFRIMNSFE